MSQVITNDALRKLVGAWIAGDTLVAGPAEVKSGLFQYAPLKAAEDLVLEGFIRPGNSIKEFIFPRHEKIYRYRFKGHQIELDDEAIEDKAQIIIGARPCDAASLPILDHVFNWDYEDEFYTKRRAATTIVTLACSEYDSECFCTSVGLGPAAEKGSDAMLLPLGDGGFEVRCFTDKGKALFEGQTQDSDKAAEAIEGPKPAFEAAAIRDFVAGGFDNPVWTEVALRCLGCGACAYTCPTCHCFDIVDEGNAAGGSRVKNWDSCQFDMFTMHASGHNPRSQQGHRQRQRISHKFYIYPDKFEEILCTGCGNCTRNCPVGLGVLNTLVEISNKALGAGQGNAEAVSG